METRAHHILIGLFTVLTALGALAFALWLGKSSADEEFTRYRVVFNEAVSGLSVGNAVQYNGIRVGDVTELRLNPEDPSQVQVGIRVRADTPVKTDTSARLGMTGITGLAFVQLYGGSPKAPLLQAERGKVPDIMATPSPLTRLMDDGQDFLVSVRTLLANTNELMSQQNIRKVSDTLTHIERATDAVAGQRDEIRQLIHSLNQASDEAAVALRQSRQVMESVQQTVSGPGKASIEGLQRTVAALEHTSQTLEKLLHDNRHALDSGLRGVTEIGPAMAELRGTLANLRQATRQLTEGSGNLLSREQNREFQP